MQFEEGKRGRAMLAGDGKAYLTFDASNIPAKEGTLEFWFKPLNWDGLSTNTFHVFVETPADAAGRFFLVYKYYFAQNAGFYWEKGGSITQRKYSGWRGWVHFAVTWSPTGCRMYFNGEPSAVVVPKNPPDSYVGMMKVGDRGWKIERDEQTLIDELYIYDRALEPEEIKWAMEHTATRPAGQDVAPGLVPTKVHAKILPSSGRITAQVRHRLEKGMLKGLTGTAELLGPTPIAVVPLTVKEKTAEAVLPFEKLSAGSYSLRVRFKDASGKVVDEAADEFLCTGNEWLGNDIGISETPPPPWTPVEAAQKRFSCWGRTYGLDGSGLPQSIRSARSELLSGPVQLHASADGQAVKWLCGEPKLVNQSEVAAEYEGQWKSPIGTLHWKALAEYDGMFKYTLALEPKRNASLNSLELRFPLREKHAGLHHCHLSTGTVIGATPQGEGVVVKASGARYWWLGDEERGLLAFCESDQAWDRIDRKDGFRFERAGDTVEAVWSFIDGNKPLLQPWKFTFGLTATPVKDTAGLRGRPSRIMRMNPWLMPGPRGETPAHLEAIVANEGIRDEIWSNFLVLWAGGEWRTYHPNYGRPEAYREALDKLAAKGLCALPYMLSREIPESVPEWRFWSAEWELGKKSGLTDETWDSTTCTRSWSDFIVWFRMMNLKRYGYAGYYIDNSMPKSGVNLDVGLGYIRDGRVRETIPYFGIRDLHKRLYTAVKQYGAEENKPVKIMCHVSGEWPVSYMGFMDNRLDGEQYMAPVRHLDPRKRYHDLIPLDKWRALSLSANSGSMPVFFPTFHKDDLGRIRELLGFLMLHDMIGVWGSSRNAQAEEIWRMWRLQDEFGVEDAKLIPYWKNSDVIAGQTETIKASAYRKAEGAALIVICNLSEEQQTTNLSVAWNKLKSKEGLAIADAETGTALKISSGELKIKIAPRDYRVVWVK